MFQLSYGVQLVGYTQYFHETHELAEDVDLAIADLKKRGISGITVYKVHKEEVTSDFISQEGESWMGVKGLVYSNKEKTIDENGWILAVPYLERVKEKLEDLGYGGYSDLMLEDIESILLVANGEEELVKKGIQAAKERDL